MLRPKTTVCREGWYYLVIVAVVFGGAMLKDVNLLLILAGMLLGPVLLNWHGVRATLRGLRLERTLPPWGGAGDVLSVGLSLTNGRRRLGSWAVVVEEHVERETPSERDRDDEPAVTSVLFPYVAAGQSAKLVYRNRLMRRGRYRFAPPKITTRFPFGLFSRTIVSGPSETLMILPRLGRLTEGWSARRIEAISGADRRRRRPGPEGDFFGVRQWRPGDGRRLIHWRSSARLGALVVRQLERPQSRDLALVLDLWQPGRPSADELRSVEAVVSFAATVIADLCRKGGSNVHLGVCNAEAECVGGAASPATLQSLMERLAIAEATNDDALPALLHQTLRRMAADAELVLVSTRPIDLTDAARFTPLGSEPSLRERLRHARCIDVSSGQLDQYFNLDEPQP